MHHVSFGTAAGYITVEMKPGSSALVAGPNGVGKSALLSALYRSLPRGVGVYLPGHRQIYFNNGWSTQGQDSAQFVLSMWQHVDAFNRTKGAWADEQFKVTLKTLHNVEAAYDREVRLRYADGTFDKAEYANLKASPVDAVNTIFAAAKLPVSFLITRDGISATRRGAVYSIDAMSDGERAALFLAASIVSAPDNSVVLIDEPEKHLHPSITGLLVSSAMRSRPDLSTIISSHDVHLIESFKFDQIIHIKDSSVTQFQPEARIFDAAVIPDLSEITESLKSDLLGARSSVLFVEGETTSADLALYNLIYENMKIAPRGGHREVIDSVTALKAMPLHHWLTPFGLIDADGRDNEEKSTLAEKGIFSLPCPSIENLFFIDDVVDCFLDARSLYETDTDASVFLARLEEEVLGRTDRYRNEVIAARSSWALERALNGMKMGPNQILKDRDRKLDLSVSDLVDSASALVDTILESRDWRNILFSLPLKHTPLPQLAAKALGANSFTQYRSVILRQLEMQAPSAQKALARLKSILAVVQ